MEYRSMVAGDREPGIEIEVADSRDEVDFHVAVEFRIICVRDNVVTVDDAATDVVISTDGKSATVRRVWGTGETDVPGRVWVSAVVVWASDRVQTFPDDGPLRLDITRASGSA